MSYEQPLLKLGEFPSEIDRTNITTYQYSAVAVAPSTTIVGAGVGNATLQAPAAGGRIIGILQDNPRKGQAAEVTALGISKWRAAGSFSVGDELSTDVNGYAVKGSGGTVVAIALEQAVAGDITTVLLK
ncbi:MAG: hypothetical protein EOO38_00260 [Cytophagaceae bacterium]|nr:MAG: hypothetical protein EOO38_00260 [Cytophagaceae bacterium]